MLGYVYVAFDMHDKLRLVSFCNVSLLNEYINYFKIIQ